MTYPDDQNLSATHSQAATDEHSGPAVTVSEERLRVSTQWVQSGRVRLRRQVVSETRTIEVTVRREELVVEAFDTGAADTGADASGGDASGGDPSGTHEPMVFVLHEEVPQIAMAGTRAYERVTVHVDVAVSEQSVGGQVRREQADVDIVSAGDSDSPPSASPR